jgi:hypothetical protein
MQHSCLNNMNGCQQSKRNKKSGMPKMQLKNGTIFNMDTKKWIQNILK